MPRSVLGLMAAAAGPDAFVLHEDDWRKMEFVPHRPFQPLEPGEGSKMLTRLT